MDSAARQGGVYHFATRKGEGIEVNGKAALWKRKVEGKERK